MGGGDEIGFLTNVRYKFINSTNVRYKYNFVSSGWARKLNFSWELEFRVPLCIYNHHQVSSTPTYALFFMQKVLHTF